MEGNVTAEQALQNEQNFFSGTGLQPQELTVSRELRSLPNDRKGTVQLIKKLVQTQQVQIRKQMPGLRRSVSVMHMAIALLVAMQTQLPKLGGNDHRTACRTIIPAGSTVNVMCRSFTLTAYH